MASRVELPPKFAALGWVERASSLSAHPAMAACRERVTGLRVAGIRDNVRYGRDARGRALAPLKPSTLARRRGGGPILAPRGEASPINNPTATWRPEGAGGFVLELTYPGHPEVGYLDGGTRYMAARDVLSMPAPVFRAIADDLGATARAILRGTA
jgi:hypothetical protein